MRAVLMHRMRPALLICVLTAATASACGAGSPSVQVDRQSPAPPPKASSPPKTSLAITVDPDGIGRPGAQHYKLSCDPPTGTVPHPARACRVLASLAAPFALVPPGTVCGQIVIGPQEARITGELRGRRIAARLSLRDTCEVERWNKVRAVVPGYPRR